MKKPFFCHGMTARELIDWNVSIGRITKKQASYLRRHEYVHSR